jgi:hypothetical protein
MNINEFFEHYRQVKPINNVYNDIFFRKDLYIDIFFILNKGVLCHYFSL